MSPFCRVGYARVLILDLSARSYIARMMGELLEDVDPCETVEYVLPLLNGFAMDEGEQTSLGA